MFPTIQDTKNVNNSGFYSISQNQFHISVYRAESRFGSGLAENQEDPKDA